MLPKSFWFLKAYFLQWDSAWKMNMSGTSGAFFTSDHHPKPNKCWYGWIPTQGHCFQEAFCCFTWSYRLPSPCSYNVFLLQNLSPVSCSISTLCYQIISNFKEIQVSHSSPTQVRWKMFNRFAEFMDICQTGSTVLSEGEGFQLGISRNIGGFPKSSQLWNVRRHSNHSRSSGEES